MGFKKKLMNLRLLCCKLTVGFHFVARNQALLFFCMFRTVPAMAPFRRHVSCQVNHGAIWHCFEYTNTQGHTSGNEYLCICTYCTYVCVYIYINSSTVSCFAIPLDLSQVQGCFYNRFPSQLFHPSLLTRTVIFQAAVCCSISS